MASQRGLFTASQGRQCGYTTDELQQARVDGVLASVRRGVYALAATYHGLPPLERHLVDTQAALMRLTAAATLSHETAAVWTGVELLRPDLGTVHVTRPELPASHLSAGIHHHPGALPKDQMLTLGGVRVTSPARSAVDIARRADFPRGLAAVDSCLRAGTTAAELLTVLEFCRAWAGARGASRAVSAGDGRAANPGESFSRAVLIENGLAPSALQHAVHDGRGLIGYADFAWPEHWTLGEFDGRLKYAVPEGADPDAAGAVVWAEKQREDRFRNRGYEVVRWTWVDLYRPGQLVGRLLAAFARGSALRRTG
jgi:hypothetical protein